MLHYGDLGLDRVSTELADRVHRQRSKPGSLLARLDQDLLRLDVAEAAEADASSEQPGREGVWR